VGGEPARALPVAAAIELIHNYSLIHDDIQDDDRERRHRPTVWSIWGKPQAINAGTAMRILASLALSRIPDGEVPLDKRLRAQRLLDECTLRLIEGQYLDISYESRLDIRVNDYLTMIERKTAALIACSLEAGALLGTDDEERIEGFREIGRNLGLAFQIRDDILGIWGDEKKTGKPIGSDIRRRKKSLPIVYALEKSESELKKKLISVYQNGALNDGGVDIVLKILDTVNAQSQTQRMADKYCDRALDGIKKADLVPSLRRDLEELFHFLVVRSF
jgi:geranylgeranyl diphosphate synthase type I